MFKGNDWDVCLEWVLVNLKIVEVDFKVYEKNILVVVIKVEDEWIF